LVNLPESVTGIGARVALVQRIDDAGKILDAVDSSDPTHYFLRDGDVPKRDPLTGEEVKTELTGPPPSEAPPTTITTLSGRTLEVPNQITAASTRGINKNIASVDAWLINEAKIEAKSKGDDWNFDQFDRIDPKKITPAERTDLNLYLFGQEEIPLSGFKPKEIPTAAPVVPGAEFEPKDNWESNLFKAREYAIALGIKDQIPAGDWNDTVRLVANVHAELAKRGGGQAPTPAVPTANEKKISQTLAMAAAQIRAGKADKAKALIAQAVKYGATSEQTDALTAQLETVSTVATEIARAPVAVAPKETQPTLFTPPPAEVTPATLITPPPTDIQGKAAEAKRKLDEIRRKRQGLQAEIGGLIDYAVPMKWMETPGALEESTAIAFEPGERYAPDVILAGPLVANFIGHATQNRKGLTHVHGLAMTPPTRKQMAANLSHEVRVSRLPADFLTPDTGPGHIEEFIREVANQSMNLWKALFIGKPGATDAIPSLLNVKVEKALIDASEKLADALKKNPEKNVSIANAGRPEGEIETTQAHERTHLRHHAISPFGNYANRAKFFAHPGVAKAAQNPRITQAYKESVWPTEIMARITTGDTLGLTEKEAVDVFDHFFSLVLEKHGDKAYTLLADLTPKYEEEIYAAVEPRIQAYEAGRGKRLSEAIPGMAPGREEAALTGPEEPLEPIYQLEPTAGAGEPDPDVIDALMDVGKSLIEAGHVDFPAWREQMLQAFPTEDYGDMVDDTTLEIVYDMAQGEVEPGAEPTPEAGKLPAPGPSDVSTPPVPGEPEPLFEPHEELQASKINRMSDEIAGMIQNKMYVGDINKLREMAQKYFGGSLGAGFGYRDIYDAMEVGINKVILQPRAMGGPIDFNDFSGSIERLRELMKYFPGETTREQEQVIKQQFDSTPPVGMLAAYACGLQPNMDVAEPSAGVGGLAVYAKLMGAHVFTNEIDENRRISLKVLGFRPTAFDAERLGTWLHHNDIKIKFDIGLMNPPFSSALGLEGTANDTQVGANHVLAMLKLLKPGGRVVAIVGEGMAHHRSSMSKWWESIEKKYNVRANIGLDKKEFAKYGTHWPTQLLIIDNTGPTPGINREQRLQNIVKGIGLPVEDAFDLVKGIGEENVLERIRNAEKAERAPEKPGVPVGGPGTEPTPPGGVGGVGPGAGGVSPGGTEGAGGVGGITPGRPATPEPTGAEGITGPGTVTSLTEPPTELGGEPRVMGAGLLEHAGVGAAKEEDKVYSEYVVEKAIVPGSIPHPARLVQSSVMASVRPPGKFKVPNLPDNVINNGLLSTEQLEAISYALEQFDHKLPNGSPPAFWLGDGTGVGKGRTIAGIIWHYLRDRGVDKAVWISCKSELITDAQRDTGPDDGIGLPLPIIRYHDTRFALNKKSAKTGQITKNVLPPEMKGVLFTTYSHLSHDFQSRMPDPKLELEKRPDDVTHWDRMEQLGRWLGSDFDGMIVFDESHKMKNAVGTTRGGRATKAAGSNRGQMGEEIQRLFPKAKILMVSATGATEARNMGYMTRLGLWGEAPAPFPTFEPFLDAIRNGGVGAMEMLARDLKATGAYISRTISYGHPDDPEEKKVEYEIVERKLNPEDIDLYNALCDFWSRLYNEFKDAAMTESGPGKTSVFASQFFGSQQRFFNQLMLSLQIPTMLERIDQDLAAGYQAIINIYSTSESKTVELAAAALAEGIDDLSELELTPMSMIQDLLNKYFPIHEYTEVYDPSTGKTIRVKVVDSQGNPVVNPEMVAIRDQLLAELRNYRMPDNPLDRMIRYFQEERNMEITELSGRKKQMAWVDGPDGSRKLQFVPRVVEGVAANQRDAYETSRFQDGVTRVAFITAKSEAGISLHDSVKNPIPARRVVYALQLPWSADSFTQGVGGRAHRTAQNSAPIIRLIKTNIASQERFINTVARRLASLGAVTKGSREALGGKLFELEDFTDDYGKAALQYVWKAIQDNEIPERDSNGDIIHEPTPGGYAMPKMIDAGPVMLERMGVLNGDGNIKPAFLQSVEHFLNRSMILRFQDQNAVFGYFYDAYQANVKQAVQTGTFDPGVTKLDGTNIRLMGDPMKPFFAAPGRFEQQIVRKGTPGSLTPHHLRKLGVTEDQIKQFLGVKTDQGLKEKLAQMGPNDVVYSKGLTIPPEQYPENPPAPAGTKLPEVIYTHPDSGAQTMLVELEVEHKVKKRNWNFSKGVSKDGYIINKASGKIYAIMIERAPERSKLIYIGGQPVVAHPVLRFSPSGTTSTIGVSETEHGDAEIKNPDKYTVPDLKEAEKLWNEQHDAYPDVETKSAHLITGAIFPIYNLIIGSGAIRHTGVVRANLANLAWKGYGPSFLGLRINPREIPALKRRLGLEATKLSDISTKDIWEKVATGTAVILNNGWALHHVGLHGGMIELTFGKTMNIRPFEPELKGYGLHQATVQFRSRWFLPQDQEDGLPVLEKLLKAHPPIEEQVPGEGPPHAPEGGLLATEGRQPPEEPPPPGAGGMAATETLPPEFEPEDIAGAVYEEPEGLTKPPKQYFEDLPLADQERIRQQYKAEVEAIGSMDFPVQADFGGDPVTILGPAHNFEPYKGVGKPDNNQLMIELDDGSRAITFASNLTVNGRPLVTRTAPMKPVDFMKDILKLNAPTEPEEGMTPPPGEGAEAPEGQQPTDLNQSWTAGQLATILKPNMPRITIAPPELDWGMKLDIQKFTFSDLIAELAKSLKTMVWRLRTPKGSKGVYWPHTAAVVTKYWGDLDTTIHELAHWLDDHFGIVSAWAQPRARSPYDLELLRNFAPYGSGSPKETLQYNRAEGVAEWIRAWVYNPKEAQRVAPLFNDFFINSVPGTVQDLLQDFGKKVRLWAVLDPEIKGMANVRRSWEQKSAFQRFKYFWSANGLPFETRGWDLLRAGLENKANPFERMQDFAVKERQKLTPEFALLPEKDPNIMLRNFSGIGQKAAWILENGMIKAHPDTVAVPVSGLTAANMLATVTTDWPHGFEDGDWVQLKGPPEDDFKGHYQITSTGPNTFTFPVSNTAPATSTAAKIIATTRPLYQRAPGVEGGYEWALGFDILNTSTRKKYDEELTLSVSHGLNQRVVEKGLIILKRTEEQINRMIQRLLAQGVTMDVIRTMPQVINTINGKRAAAWYSLQRISGMAGGMTVEEGGHDFELAVHSMARFGKPTTFPGINIGAPYNDYLHMPAPDTGYSDEDLTKFQEMFHRYEAIADSNLRYWVDKGRLKFSEYEKIKKNNECYFSMNRIMEGSYPGHDIGEIDPSVRAALGSQLGNAAQPLRYWHGGTPMIQDPYLSLMAQTYAFIREADRNEILALAADLLEPERQMYKGKQIQVGLAGIHLQGPTIGSVPIWRRGVKQQWKFEEGVSKFLDNWGSIENSNILFNFMKLILAKIPRRMITASPGFVVRSLIREATTRTLLVGEGSKPWDVFANPSEDVRTGYLLAGGSQEPYPMGTMTKIETALLDKISEVVGPEKRAVSTNQGKMMVAARKAGEFMLVPFSWSKHILKKGWNVYNNEIIKEYGEVRNRLTAYQRYLRKAMRDHPEWDKYNAHLWAADQARGLLDYYRAGFWIQPILRYIPFVGADIQSKFRIMKAIRQEALEASSLINEGDYEEFFKRLAYKGLLGFFLMYILLPRMAFLLLHHWMGDEELDEYKALPLWRRLFINLRVPNPVGTGHIWIPIPQGWEFGFAGLAAELFLQEAIGENQDTWKEMVQGATNTLIPVDNFMFTGPYRGFMESLYNRSFFFDKYIVPPREQNLDLSLRDPERGTRIGRAFEFLSSGLGFTVDARQWDNFIYSITGSIGIAAGHLSNIGREKGALTRGAATISGMFFESSSYPSPNVQWVMREARRLGDDNSADFKRLGDALRYEREGPTIGERERRAVKTREIAKQLRDFYTAVSADMLKLEQFKDEARRTIFEAGRGNADISPAAIDQAKVDLAEIGYADQTIDFLRRYSTELTDPAEKHRIFQRMQEIVQEAAPSKYGLTPPPISDLQDRLKIYQEMKETGKVPGALQRLETAYIRDRVNGTPGQEYSKVLNEISVQPGAVGDLNKFLGMVDKLPMQMKIMEVQAALDPNPAKREEARDLLLKMRNQEVAEKTQRLAR